MPERKWASKEVQDAFFEGDPPPLPRRTPPASERTPAPVDEPMGTVIAPTGSGKFETVANGFGGTTTRRRASAGGQGKPPSEASIGFLRTLLGEREGVEAVEPIRAMLNEKRKAGELTQKIVSDTIESLKLIPKPRKERTQRTGEQADDGFYLKDGTIWKVQTGRSGGRYAKRLIPPTPEQIAADPKAKGEWEYEGGSMTWKLTADDALTVEKAKEFGHLYGICGVCGATLRKEESIERGIGPVCFGKL